MKKVSTAQQTWIEIDKRALLSNYRLLKNSIPRGTETMCVVKGNAYGHGMDIVAQALSKARPDYFAVFTFEDALLLRKQGIKTNILVLQPAQEVWCEEASRKKIDLLVTSIEILAYIKKKKFSRKLRIHLHVETGLGREGITEEYVAQAIALLDQAKTFELVGLSTHFSGAESRDFDLYTKKQAEKLMVWRDAIAAIGLHPKVHMSGTAGALLDPFYAGGIVRFGIGLYGLWPSEETKKVPSARNVQLHPVLSWKAKIIELKILPKLSGIGYDVTYVTKRPTKIAILPVGYFDGLPRAISHKGSVVVRGAQVPYLGRVMMNMCVIDVTDVPDVKLGDEVTLVGTLNGESVSVEDMAGWAKTINYEIVTRLHPDIPRVAK